MQKQRYNKNQLRKAREQNRRKLLLDYELLRHRRIRSYDRRRF